jgi:mRNA interferase RelE/StbE
MQLHYSRHFLKDIKRLRDAVLSARIEDALEALKDARSMSNILQELPVKKLTGHDRYYRIRIGTYRLGFYLNEDQSITVLCFGHRKDFYESFP